MKIIRDKGVVTNFSNILQLIRTSPKITRADIAKKTGISAPTISRILDILFKKGLITNGEFGESKGGRPPQILRFEAESNFVIGIDLSGDSVKGALSNLQRDFSFEIEVLLNNQTDYTLIIKILGDIIMRLEQQAKESNYRLFGIGLAICGLVDRHTCKLRYSPILNWHNKAVIKDLSGYTTLPIVMENVAHVIALGESLYGVGSRYGHIINVNISYGIGSGIIIANELFYGSQGFAGELGHIILDRLSQRKGKEGIRGTLEAFASGYGLEAIAKDRIDQGRASLLSDLPRAEINASTILDAAKKGDSLSLELIAMAADYIGLAIDILIKLFNPEAITISGPLARHNDFLLNVKSKLNTVGLPVYERPVEILPSSFGSNAALTGAFALILQNILRVDELT